MAITDWPRHERPRERLIAHGATTLSDVELLAVFMRVGVEGKSAVDLARDTLLHFGSLAALFGAGLKQFSLINGLGPAKYAQLQAVRELAKRALCEQLTSGTLLGSPAMVRQYLQLVFSGKPHESFFILFLDVKLRLLAAHELFRGTLTHTAVYRREIVKMALEHNAASVILAHNHPYGDPQPSPADLDMTRAVVQALDVVDIGVMDHIIVAGTRTYSFAEGGHL